MKNLENQIEAILFAAGDGVELAMIKEKLNIKDTELEKAVEILAKKYAGENGLHILRYKKKIQLATNPKYSEAVEAVLNPIKERQLTRATLETLSIIAYKQPITRLEVEEIRGVNSDYAIEVLEKNNLIEVIGRKDSIGKPLLFGTTDLFLKRFDLQNLTDLPKYEELLEKIKVIEGTDKSSALYNEFEIPTEEVPDFLQDEKNLVEVEVH